MTQHLDNLKCGNCGFDGGLQHQKEISTLKEKISYLDAQNTILENQEPGLKRILIAITSSVLIITAGIVTNNYLNPTTKQAMIAASYESCLNASQHVIQSSFSETVDGRLSAIKNCNETFKKEMETN